MKTIKQLLIILPLALAFWESDAQTDDRPIDNKSGELRKFDVKSDQKHIDEDKVRLVLLLVIQTYAREDYLEVKDIIYDFNDSIEIRTHTGMWAVNAEASWKSTRFSADDFRIKGVVIYNPYSEHMTWRSEEVSKNLQFKRAEMEFRQLPRESEVLYGMGIGKPMRKKRYANVSSGN